MHLDVEFTLAWNIYALLGLDSVEITAEFLLAAESFNEFEDNVNQPSAYNLEVAYFSTPSMQIAFCYEGSTELVEAPKNQFGRR